MPLNLPNSAQEVEQRAKTDVDRSLENSNPFLLNSWLGALITAYANRIYDFYLQLSALLLETFWDTSTGDFLKRQMSWFGFTVNDAAKASGNVAATGNAGSTITLGAIIVTTDGVEYETTSGENIVATVIDILSVTRSGDTAYVVTDGDHNLASNVTPTIAGAGESEYNVTDAVIQVTAADQFTYEVEGSPASPATGTITASADFASVPIRSLEFQSDTLNVNLIQDTPLNIQTPIVGVDSEVKVDFNEIAGGTAEETDPDFRTRGLEGVQNPTAHFNVQEIKDTAKEVPGVTRVFVQEITPERGQVTVYFVRDNDDDIIPTAPEVADVKTALLTIKPANTADQDVIVEAPIENIVDFIFSALTPNTQSMQDAIDDNLEQFFKESTDVGADVDEDAYRAAIFSTVDTETGEQVQTFSLTSPIGDIVNASNQIPVLGSITHVPI